MKNISILGTSSDSGKSTISFVVAKLLQQQGYTVAPFKAQNVSNNSNVTAEGREIAVAQHFQADVLQVPTTHNMNPVLLKSGKGNSAQLIVQGKVVGDKDVRAYYQDLDLLKPFVKEAFQNLDEEFDIIVAEGAGSPVELNLMDKDLSNVYIATEFDTKIILVADIERGGVFASIYGTLALLPEAMRKNVIGVVINKFRGDISLFDTGIEHIEKQWKVPVLGVLPYIPFNLGFEDSQSLVNYVQSENYKCKIGVVRFPHISNFNDFEPFVLDPEVKLDFVQGGLENYDILILPGSKKTIADLQWLKETGLYSILQNTSTPIFGVCGGYEMMFDSVSDPYGVEHEAGSSEEGLRFFSGDIIFAEEKILRRGAYQQFGENLEGYEIHCGKAPVEFQEGGLYQGTFLHGLFDNETFRTKFVQKVCNAYEGFSFEEYKRQEIDSFVEKMGESLDLFRIEQSISV